MDLIIWNEKLSVGVKLFDDEHKNLIAFLNKLDQALKIGSTQITIGEILTDLIKYTKIHFKHEEEYMLKYEYPDYKNHKKEHDELTKQVSEFYDRFSSGKASFSLELMNFLQNWLKNHIQGTDMSYKKFFISKGI